MMRLRILAVVAAATLALSGCGGSADDNSVGTPTANQPTPTAAPTGDTGGGQASGEADCSVFSKDELIQFVMYTQFIGQVRDVSGLSVLSQVGYTPQIVADMLDDLDQLKGIESELYGTPDEGLANFRTANDLFGEILAKGDAASDADFAPLDDMWATHDEWIKEQAAITGALNVACPGLA